ncbi:hypothetical protein ACGFYA_08815 [Streptomyces sp. NPDC048305]|uniref:hypothetical protein n=1 Tax=Streptomyces sp. NPDC048305 TaxID=3365532 RepID=UPI00371B32F7
MTDKQKQELRELVSRLGGGVRDAHYATAHEAALSFCSGVSSMIPVELHDLMHESALAGYAAELNDLEAAKLDDRDRERSNLLQ